MQILIFFHIILLIFIILFLLSVVLITGGYNRNGGLFKSAEIFNPVTKSSCSLPPLPKARQFHSQDGGLTCGGGVSDATQKTCVKWSSASGTWTQSHTLKEKRAAHVSWTTVLGKGSKKNN